MERITYLLGAGFSAPLGLPVMSNFIEKSKDLYFSEREKYNHFRDVLDKIRELSYIKNFYTADLTNIEEILSVIEMSNYVGDNKIKREFKRYIVDVIQGYTKTATFKEFQIHTNTAWFYDLFAEDNLNSLYAYFVAHLFNLRLYRMKGSGMHGYVWSYHAMPMTSLIKYSILTLNYDLILENTLALIKNKYSLPEDIMYENLEYNNNWNRPHLAKLHGCVSSGNIVPPTWAKGSSDNSEIKKIWANSYKILRDSSQIRVIGYSLPISDAYLKYLLKAAIVENENLKNIDVITLDPTGNVQVQYKDYIKFPKYRFRNSNVIDYLKILEKQFNSSHGVEEISMDKLEIAHEKFMNGE